MKGLNLLLILTIALFGLTAISATANALTPDDVFIGVHADSNHGDPGYNEDHNWKSIRLSWDLSDNWKSGLGLEDFKNSVSKDTTTIGPFIEYDIMHDVMFVENAGLGATAKFQLRKGYNLDRIGVPFIPLVYTYAEGSDIEELGFIGDVVDRTRVNYSYVPEVSNTMPDQHLFLFELKVWER